MSMLLYIYNRFYNNYIISIIDINKEYFKMCFSKILLEINKTIEIGLLNSYFFRVIQF